MTCGPVPSNLPPIYVSGGVVARFPSRGLAWEYHVLQHGRAAPLPLGEALSEGRFIARRMSWVLQRRGLPLYYLAPSTPWDLDDLLQTATLEGEEGGGRVTVAGWLGETETRANLTLPVLHLEVVHVRGVAPPPEGPEAQAWGLLEQLADNPGRTAEHRALNFLVARFQDLRELLARRIEANQKLAGVRARPSRLSASGQVIDIIFDFRSPEDGAAADSQFVRVDVSEVHPFPLNDSFQAYFER